MRAVQPANGDNLPITTLRELALASAASAALRAVTRVGLADVLGDEPIPAGELAKTLGVDAAILTRTLRNLRCYGLFDETDKGIVHTETSKLLREDHPQRLKNWVQWATEPWVWALWPDLEQALRTGRGHFNERFGEDFFTHLHKEWPESTGTFNRSQTELSAITSTAIADTLNVADAKTFADVGGGSGYTLATVLERHPHLHGTLVDLAAAVASPDPRLRPGGALAARSQVIAGDCLTDIPVDADVYQFKSVLEWDDELTVTALANAKRAGHSGSRVLVITNLIDNSPEIRYATGVDLLLLLNTNGKRHTEAGVTALAERAGLRVVDVTPAGSLLHIVETVIP